MIRRLSVLTVCLLLLLAGAASARSLVTRYVAGDHYKVIDQPVAQPDDGKVHVVEFFLYSCPHCYHLDPAVPKWRDQLGDDVVFSRLPVLFGGGGQQYARLYYTAKALGVLDKVHSDIFDAIHQKGQRLVSQDDMRRFMVDHGVDSDRFDKVFESDAVKDQVRHAGEVMRAFHVTAVPSLGVAGRYWITGRTAGSNEAMFDVADYLIGQERAKR